MACKYCAEWPNVDIFNNRDKLSLKKDGYPGIEVNIDPFESKIWIGACADTYEPGWVEAEFEINFCPMCGKDLKGVKDDC